jgi:exodeoxyribonuclease VII small subunit
MSAGKKKTNFEEALCGLEKSVEALKSDSVSLEQAIKNFEEGVAFYEQCESILREARQKVEVVNYERISGVRQV